MKQLGRLAAAAAIVAAMLASEARAASISLANLDQSGPNSLTFLIDSVAASSTAGTFGRYRISSGFVSSMGQNVPPNDNIVGNGQFIWFTTLQAPYRTAKADLGTASGSPVFYTASGITTPFDDATFGPDGNYWAANSGSRRIVRTTAAGVTTSFTGNGTIGPSGITRHPDGNLWVADAANRRISKVNPATGAFTDYAVPQLSANTIPVRIQGFGTGARVWFATLDGFGSVDPATSVVTMVPTEAQSPQRLVAGIDGTLWMTLGTQYVMQFTPPANYAKLKVFSAPNAASAGLFVDDSGIVYVGDRTSGTLARIAVAEHTAGDTIVTEFYNSILNHYFVTANLAEAASIDAGGSGPGWSRTNQTWKAWVNGPIPNAAEVCRFYGSIDINPATGQRRGPNSHFYTLEPAECAAVKTDAGWTFEFAGKFWLVRPVNNACPAWTQAIYRVYNNRFAFNDSNHRYMISVALYNAMLGLGWAPEGIVACAPL